MALFKKTSPNKIHDAVVALRQSFSAAPIIPKDTAKLALGFENLNDTEQQVLEGASDEVKVTIQGVLEKVGFNVESLSDAQLEAGALAYMYCQNPRELRGRQQVARMPSGPDEYITAEATDIGLQRSLGFEAYDEQNIDRATVYSVVMNVFAARQDELGETFFPTIMKSQDDAGFGIRVPIMTVMDNNIKPTTGTFKGFQRKNVIRAWRNPKIMKTGSTLAIPVFRAGAETEAKFVAAADFTPVLTAHDDGDEQFLTSFLKVGVPNVSLLGLSQHPTLIARGQMDETDSLDRTVHLQKVLIKIGNDRISVDVELLPLNNFVSNGQSNYRDLFLNFSTKSVVLTAATKTAAGGALTGDLATELVTANRKISLRLDLSGRVNVETGEIFVTAAGVSAVTVVNAVTGEVLDPAAAGVADLVAAVNAAEVRGYKVYARRANAQRAIRGQFVDTTYITQLYNIPQLAPISTKHPVWTESSIDSTDIQTLISSVRARLNNEVVEKIQRSFMTMKLYHNVRDDQGEPPDILGLGRKLVIPTYFEENLDMTAIVDSLTSVQRPADIQAALVNKIRDYAYRLYRDSEYKAAASVYLGDPDFKPTVIVGTDQVIANYLMVTGDLRTLGNGFEVRVVSSPDERMDGKIYITFGVFDQKRNSEPNVLNFGNLFMVTEMVTTLPAASRGDSISRETVLMPRWLIETHLPVGAMLTVENMPNVLNKVPVQFDAI